MGGRTGRDGHAAPRRAQEQQARVALARGDDERARHLATDLRERAAERRVGSFVEPADEILETCDSGGE